ncbi:helix-turn-helix transcriptional regulator [Actinocorallia sp. API 0066]|uniref:helix-turn-helix transcriptional regulator n=1 Tax=Actinocorallia sp. API 0066 TaxID=2896846 RepID=UPI001E4B2C0C|nr:helix-turn-helix transcriptional regulator [Actinocorallia sp. API 0066]MCD0451772.1 helix-turn-helix transcriptional regulator [Actinocorallia sp. API 0066]
MDRGELARFLRGRRAALQPEDVGLPRGRQRRTSGLRREEVAALSNMSTDYYSRIEQRRGPRPSAPVLGAIARALRLTDDERDHLFRLAGHPPPAPSTRADLPEPGILQILRRLEDTPAHIVNHLGETLAQNRLSRLLLGDQTAHTGPARALAYRWFTDPAERRLTPPEDHTRHGRALTAQLLAAHTRDPRDPRSRRLVDDLLEHSAEFADLWSERPVTGPYCADKRLEHPRVGALDLHGQSLLDPGGSQILTVLTAVEGGDSDGRLRFLSVLGDDTALTR